MRGDLRRSKGGSGVKRREEGDLVSVGSPARGKRLVRALGAITALVMLAGCSIGQQAATSDRSNDQLPEGQMNALLKDAVTQPGGSIGAIGYVISPKGMWQGSSGLAEITTGEPMTPALAYRIGSTTKTFTAVVVLQLVGEGRLGLDDPVSRYVPGLLPYPEPITVRQLLNHTSGIFDYGHSPGSADPSADVPRIRDPALRREAQRLLALSRRGQDVLATPELSVAAATTHPLDFPPGQGFSYSNTGYQILTLLIERITGQPLAASYRQRIFRPLAMRDTYLPSDRTIRGAHVHAYTPDETTGSPTDTTADIDLGHWGEGGLISTATDVATFYRALLGGRLLAPPLLAQMLQEAPQSALGAFASGYGLGIEHLRNPCGLDAWGHGGDLAGFKTTAIASRDGRYVAVLVLNLTTTQTEDIRSRLAPELLCSARDAARQSDRSQGGS
jgi:D-alanyl-D-alanine carboxypeptidase